MKKKYFGTDGIRGRVGTEKIHPEFIMKLGWALGRVLNHTDHKKVIIGKDTRISGYMFESALEAGFSAAGVDVRLIGPMPTPAIAYLTQTFRANAGVVISASHNPYQDNGIKFFDSNGEKLPDEIELAIEAEMAKPFELQEPHLLGKASRINDANGRYIEFCKSTISSKLRLNGLKIVLDCANGATYRVAPSVFKELGAQVIVIGDKPDGLNINHECGSTHPEHLQAKVLACQADLGIAFDGDGDRVVMVDHQGQLINGDGVLYLIATDRHEQKRLQGGVVGTLMTNMALEVKFKELQIPFIRSNVGDRYVLAELKKNNWIIGGETSGHIVCLDKTTTGDGIIAALQVLANMVREQKSLAELMSEIQFYPQVLLNIKTANASVLMESADVMHVIEKHVNALEGRGRILVRPSGTEPLLRILLEGPNEAELIERKNDIEQVVNQIKENA
ncbi:MAG TPA: phosphoglucosamine mutase [Legionellales bacterium]|nr:phosphoglucosamine mutase [Legionellales bacterium]